MRSSGRRSSQFLGFSDPPQLLGKKSALFFELDGVVRQLSSAARARHRESGVIPPAPTDVGEQILVEPVVKWLIAYSQEHDCIPVGIDQAPYLEHGFDILTYTRILNELKGLLGEAGLRPPPNFRDAAGKLVEAIPVYTCPHAAVEDWVEDVVNPINGEMRKAPRMIPHCGCRFPNPDLFRHAGAALDLTRLNIPQSFRFFAPTKFVYATDVAREAALVQSGCDTIHVNNLLTGRVKLKGLIGHQHLKAAALIREHQRRHGLTSHGVSDAERMAAVGRAEVHLDARSLPELPPLPPELNVPLTP